MNFKVEKKVHQSSARAGRLTTDHGDILTPIFMPVGTQATVKTLRQQDLTELEAQIILGNTFHLYLRPGHDLISAAGGLHKFMNWTRPILTDSGGYQVYSLSAMRKISEDGVKFQSHIDGSYHFFRPESAVEIQQHLGADIIMAFDECTPFPCEYEYAKKSMQLTHRWLDRCIQFKKDSEPVHPYDQILAPIVQGSVYPDLRKESAQFIGDKDMPINAIGGLSVGEPAPLLYEMTEIVCDNLPKSAARYLMGVGTPINLLECIDRGIDMFDCVLPTRNARHGLLYTDKGTINIKNAKWKKDFEAIDETSLSGLSRNHSRAYLRHLFVAGESLGHQIASIHNLTFYLWLIKEARKHIVLGDFTSWKKEMIFRLEQRL